MLMWTLMSFTSYAKLLSMAVGVIMAASLIFCPLAATALKYSGKTALWFTYVFCLFLFCASCAYKLSGLASGNARWWSVAYVTWEFLVIVGLPFAAAAIVLREFTATRSYSYTRAAVFGWMASVAVVPISILLLFSLDVSIVMIARKILS